MKIEEAINYKQDIDELLNILIEVKEWMVNQGILKSKTMNRVNEVLNKYEVNKND
jgi:hypothetical protein